MPTPLKKDAGLEELIDILKTKETDFNEGRIRRAYRFAKKAHEGQFRMSGEPYILHPLAAAKILANLGVDEDTIITGLLHDVPEDTTYEVEDIEKRFGKHVATLVSALTKLSKVYYKHSMGERQIRSLRKMFVETANDVRVVIVKLADRLHNMQTLQYLRPDKQQRIAKETLEIYAPLANLYGIYQLRRQLEDLCFMYLQPEEYARISTFVHDHEKKRNQFIKDCIRVLEKELGKVGISVEITGRSKHFYSIYQKLIRDRKMLQDIYDYSAIRIIVGTKMECYQTLSIVHDVFKPKPKRFKDYIALPKANGYQSLHTTVIGLRGKLTEIQIRTKEMHLEAEYGAASHIFFKDASSSYLSEGIAQLKKYKSPERFIQGLQEDILQDRIYVFSPSGEIVNLPQGATCLDYVYAVNLPVDTKVFRAVVNRKPYSLIGELQSGDYVEIVYGQKVQKGPQRWWLDHVRTARAKKKLREYFQEKSLDTRVGLGEQLLQQKLDHENKGLVYQLPPVSRNRAVEEFACKNFDELLSKVGEGSLDSNAVYKAMFPYIELSSWSHILQFFKRFKKRFGGTADHYNYQIRIIIESYDRVGLLKDILSPFYELEIPIVKIRGNSHRTKKTLQHILPYGPHVPGNPNVVSRDIMEIKVNTYEELIALFDRIERVPGVIQVQRSFRGRQLSFSVWATLTLVYLFLHPLLLQVIRQSELIGSTVIFNIIIYLGLFSVFGLLYLLRSMGNKTFPHFEETKYFWPVSFGMTFLVIIILLLDNIIFDLQLQLPIQLGMSGIILGFLYFTYRAHEQRRTQHLKRLRKSYFDQATQ